MASCQADHTGGNLGPRSGSDAASPDDAGARLGRSVVVHDGLDAGIRALAKDAHAARIAGRRHVHIARIPADADHASAEQKLVGVLVGNFSALTEHADTGKHIVRSGLQARDASDTVYACAAGTAAKQAFAAASETEDAGAFARSTEPCYTGGIAACVGEKPAAAFAALRENARATHVAAQARDAGAAAFAREIGAEPDADDRVDRHGGPKLTVLLRVLRNLDHKNELRAEIGAKRTGFDRADSCFGVTILRPDRGLVVGSVEPP